MSTENNSMIYPKIEGLLERSLKQGEEDSHSKFRLVTLAAQRARQINAVSYTHLTLPTIYSV